MIVFPYQKYKLSTNLSPNEVNERLRENIVSDKILSGRWDGDLYYEGITNCNEFEINNRRSGSTQLIPIISNLGEVEETEKGSIIYVKCYLIISYYLFYLGFPAICIAIGINQALTFSNLRYSVYSILFGIGIYIVFLLMYAGEAIKARKFFIKTLEAKVII